MALATLILAGRMFGEIAKRFSMPSIVGEIFGGILLGPTVLGQFYPLFTDLLYSAQGTNAALLEKIVTIAGCAFLFSAGMEVNLSTIKRRYRSALMVSLGGLVVPFLLGFILTWYFPHALGFERQGNVQIYALFIATALSISALPVIAKTLMDLKLYHSELGMVVMSAVTIDDIAGWLIFGALLQNNLGTHAYLISFLVGIAAGNLFQLDKRAHEYIGKTAQHICAPLFFTSIGLHVNVINHFDWSLTLIIIAVACIGKVLGGATSARLSGMPVNEACAVGFGMNSRGAMEIILGLSALQAGIIKERVFVSLVVMAIFTSVISGPLMRYALMNPRKSSVHYEIKGSMVSMLKRLRYIWGTLLFFCLLFSVGFIGADPAIPNIEKTVHDLCLKRPGKSGAYVLEKGEESLLARAWLTDHAKKTIDIQYFIWSVDNIGILASEALIRAADRGVHIRVLVDDFGVNATAENILVVASHPLIDIRIYNPQTKVGVSRLKRFFNMAKDFRGINQRMHDKTFIVDDSVAITGGRNMADEYYDYDQAYNFRDRDILLLGPVVKDMERNFDDFWNSALSMPVETLLEKEVSKLSKERIDGLINELHEYAGKKENFADEVKVALENLPQKFSGLLKEMVWDDVRFVHDQPGKNDGGWSNSGDSTRALVEVLKSAKSRIVIQSPYLVIPKGGLDLFRNLIAKGVTVKVVTNSLPSTDNLYAFSGYSKQRKEILAAGIDVFEYRPNPKVQQELFERFAKVAKTPPIFAIHAKTFVVDGETLFVGTFNLDPRSAHLNTEVGILISNPKIASEVEQFILTDMKSENSWNARFDNPDSFAPRIKRLQVFLQKLLPLEPLL